MCLNIFFGGVGVYMYVCVCRCVWVDVGVCGCVCNSDKILHHQNIVGVGQKERHIGSSPCTWPTQ